LFFSSPVVCDCGKAGGDGFCDLANLWGRLCVAC
jgi:hypothetical protein